MSCFVPGVIGRQSWSGERDENGHRSYKLLTKVKVVDTPGAAQGPATVLLLNGLPAPGDVWDIEDDVDTDATCRFDAVVKQFVDDGGRTEYYTIEQTFSTKPDPKCFYRLGSGTGTGNPALNPLLEAPTITGGFQKYTEQAQYDKDGSPLLSTSFERLRGPQVEFDHSRPTIKIEQNEATLNLDVLTALVDTVNSTTMWGFAPRCVKLSNISWQKLYFAGCSCYFRIAYEFEVNTDTFDRLVLDEGTKVIHGEWVGDTWAVTLIDGVVPDPSNAEHFIQFHDRFGNLSRTVLRSDGRPISNDTEAHQITVQYYYELNFFSYLNIPSSLEC